MTSEIGICTQLNPQHYVAARIGYRARTVQRRLGRWVLVLVAASGAVRAFGATPTDEHLASVRALLDLPEDKIDLAKVKLTVDRMIDPQIDIAVTVAQLDAMALQIKTTLPPGASSRSRVEALRSFLYDAGSGKRPFRYDMQDPSGRNIHNKLLPTYLATRRGNCISMPFLFIVLGQRLGLDVTAATAPEHVFVKFRDDTGVWFNLETTSGAGFTSDAWIQKNMPMSAQALANGVYMRPLTKKQTVAVILVTLMEWHGQQGHHEARRGQSGAGPGPEGRSRHAQRQRGLLRNEAARVRGQIREAKRCSAGTASASR